MRLTTPILAALLGVLSAAPAAAQKPASFEFQAVGVRQKVGCVNDPVTQLGYRFVYGHEDIAQRRRAYRDSLQVQHDSLAVLTDYTVTIGKPKFIALVRKKVFCKLYSGGTREVATMTYYASSDSLSIEKDMLSDKRLHPEIYEMGVIEWIRWHIFVPEFQKWLLDPKADRDKPVFRTTPTTWGVRG